jgi:hypothetical protein
MGTKLLWTGLTMVVALNPFLSAIGLSGGSVLVVAGAVIMVIGCIALWLDK